MSAASEDNPGVIAFPPLIFATCALLGAGAHWLWPLPLLPALAARVIGAALAVAAGTQAIWAARSMRRAGTNVNPSQPALAIVVAGPYAYTRNPMYLSLCTLQVGLGLLLNGLLPVLFIIPLALILQFGVIKREERYLTAKFGENYLAYQRRVRRWV